MEHVTCLFCAKFSEKQSEHSIKTEKYQKIILIISTETYDIMGSR